MQSIRVYIKPGAKKQKVIIQKDLEENETYIVNVTSLPKDGEANTELFEVLADYFDLPKSSFSIKSGYKSRYKIVVF